ncbi:VCBS repeat-containing protein [Streptomyces sp. S07_1.15]|uniref:FG-GAP repeat domain-containing protein n=1 Tax=Streptomyces sp. S07_1.15 TaxID=2873925 RepID=UPI001D140430|nr:VCBS repeat-containing protein [Streptomyces sp. S07_1.15]MCC3652962.1 VCBS repeat-containing protein [Streptomyces sp. S07_1.15]
MSAIGQGRGHVVRGGEGTPGRVRCALALAATVLVTGCGDGLGDPPPRPTAGPVISSCVTPSGDLVADLNADGTADRVSPPSLTGAGLTVTFGAENGRDTEVGPRDLVGKQGEDAVDVLAAVADFDQDGWNDLFIAATGANGGDDPLEPEVSELRLGPFSPRGRGQSAHPVELSEPRAVTVADYNHDRYPDLASYGHEGDGVYATTARLGGGKGVDRGFDEGNKPYEKEAERTGRMTPESMPEADPTAFHPPCAGDDGPG